MSLFVLYEQRFPRYGQIFKIAIFGHETWLLAKDPEVAHILTFHPRALKVSLLSLYKQWFPRYGPIFKIAINFGYETWPLAKVPEVAHTMYTLFLPQEIEIELIFTHFLPKLYPPPPESQISPRFAVQLAIFKILAFFYFPIGYNVKFQSFFKKI